jgi:hypothetical protein
VQQVAYDFVTKSVVDVEPCQFGKLEVYDMLVTLNVGRCSSRTL